MRAQEARASTTASEKEKERLIFVDFSKEQAELDK